MFSSILAPGDRPQADSAITDVNSTINNFFFTLQISFPILHAYA